MATRKLSVGTCRDRDGVRRSHKRGAASLRVIGHAATYFDALTEEALMRHGWYRRKMEGTT